MALKAILDSIDDLNDGVKEHYKARDDGKFVLSVEAIDGLALEDVSGLKTALGKERTTRENLERQVVKFKDLDPEKAREALAKLAEFENIDPTKEADKIANTKFEAAKRQLLEKHAAELQTIKDREGHLTRTVEGLMVDQVATAALAEAKGSVELLLPHVQRHTRVKEIDGKFKVEVVDAEGNARIANGKADPMTIKDLVAEMKASETFGRAFDASGQTGSGMHPGGNGAGGAGRQKGNFGGSKEERVAALKAKFPGLRAG
jgi:hypothetical protein